MAQHDSLEAARDRLHDDDFLFAFLDDLYVVTTRERARGAYDAVTEEVARGAGVRTNLGKLRIWSKAGGECPPGFEEFGADTWAGGAVPERRGIKVLGTPLGHPAFVRTLTDKRLDDEERFLSKLLRLGDVQCAWLLLSYCGVPRANHLVRVLPPEVAEEYAARHDCALWRCLCALLGCESRLGDTLARDVATLPVRLGGLGLRSAARTSPAAYWAAWVDGAAVLASKAPRLSALFLHEMRADEGSQVECIRTLRDAEAALVAAGCKDRPSWDDAARGARAPYAEDIDAGERRKG